MAIGVPPPHRLGGVVPSGYARMVFSTRLEPATLRSQPMGGPPGTQPRSSERRDEGPHGEPHANDVVAGDSGGHETRIRPQIEPISTRSTTARSTRPRADAPNRVKGRSAHGGFPPTSDLGEDLLGGLGPAHGLTGLASIAGASHLPWIHELRPVARRVGGTRVV